MLSGDNSILNQAGRARDITGEKSIAERVQIAYLGALTTGNGEATEPNLINELTNEFGEHYKGLKKNESNKPIGATIDEKDYYFDGTVTPGDGEKQTVSDLRTASISDGVTPLSTTDTTTIKDNKDNEIKVPKGFGIATDSGINVAEGIVIEDADSTRQTYRSQFVWVPVGTITKTDSSTETITLGRYTFNTSTGAETAVQTQTGTTYMATTSASVISSYYEFKDDAESQAIKSATYGNTKAKSISDFVESAISNKGYYIARYEVGISGTTDNNSLETKTATDGSVKPQSKSGLGVWNSITQLNAAVVCQSMYNTTNDKVTSDLVNSYAWDTAILFIQKCGNNGEDSSKYSIQRGYSAINTSARQLTGENKLQYQPGGTTARSIAIFDTQCKICDMAGNIYEWTTETHSRTSRPCVHRGGDYFDAFYYTASRYDYNTRITDKDIGFRPLLYL